jgi:hypothetical protein
MGDWPEYSKETVCGIVKDASQRANQRRREHFTRLVRDLHTEYVEITPAIPCPFNESLVRKSDYCDQTYEYRNGCVYISHKQRFRRSCETFLQHIVIIESRVVVNEKEVYTNKLYKFENEEEDFYSYVI